MASSSKSRAALQAALAGAEAAGATTHLLDIHHVLELPIYNPRTTSRPSLPPSWSRPVMPRMACCGAARSTRGRFRRAQERARLAAPAGPIRRTFHDKVIGLISAAGGTQGLQAINTMEFWSARGRTPR